MGEVFIPTGDNFPSEENYISSRQTVRLVGAQLLNIASLEVGGLGREIVNLNLPYQKRHTKARIVDRSNVEVKLESVDTPGGTEAAISIQDGFLQDVFRTDTDNEAWTQNTRSLTNQEYSYSLRRHTPQISDSIAEMLDLKEELPFEISYDPSKMELVEAIIRLKKDHVVSLLDNRSYSELIVAHSKDEADIFKSKEIIYSEGLKDMHTAFRQFAVVSFGALNNMPGITETINYYEERGLRGNSGSQLTVELSTHNPRGDHTDSSIRRITRTKSEKAGEDYIHDISTAIKIFRESLTRERP